MSLPIVHDMDSGTKDILRNTSCTEATVVAIHSGLLVGESQYPDHLDRRMLLAILLE